MNTVLLGKNSLFCSIAPLIVGLIACSASAEVQKVRVSDPATAASLRAQGARLIADYGTFQFFEIDSARLTSLRTTDIEAQADADVIHLNAAHLDTRSAPVKARRLAVAKFTGQRLHLVQFAAPVKPEWLQELQKTGVRVVTYIPENAYLVYGDYPALSAAQKWAAGNTLVQWEGEYSGDLKIHPAAQPAGMAKESPITDGTVSIQLVEDAAANDATLALIDQLKLAPIRRQSHALGYVNLVVQLPPAQLATLATQSDVVSILPYMERHKLDERQDQILAGNVTGSGPSAPGYLAWLASKGFTLSQFVSSGFVVDVSDSGIDNGTLAPAHFGLYQSGDPTLASRVAYARLEGTANSGSTLQGCDGHGNINTHIIAGYNNFNNSPHVDSTGYRYGLGVCPFVKVGSSVIFDPSNFTSPNYPDLQSRAYRDGARISNNSWGGSTAGAYDSDAQTYDALVRDAQPSAAAVPNAGNQEMVIVFAGGNDGPSASTVGSPGTAKNVIVVGASENVRSMNTANGGNNAAGNDGCTSPDTDADNLNDIVGFSSRGPCTDGRKKPDIVAPGTHITGGAPQGGSATTNGTGTVLTCFLAEGVCAVPGGGVTSGSASNYFPLGQKFYTESSGTSHATPAIAGGCALLRQWCINHSITPPSPAMTKAWLANSARYLNGANTGDTLPSNNQGMGLMDLGRSFDDVPRLVRDELSADKFTASGQTRTFTGSVSDNTKPFRVTLAWTDAPGATSGNSYNNDLDLTVKVGESTYKGNVFSGANSVTGGSADTKDNLESVFLPAGASGSFTITVTAANINSDGVPNEAPTLDQDFALVAYNVSLIAAPAIATSGTTITAEGCSPTNGVLDSGETVTLQFGLKNLGTAATANLTATLLATNGVSAPSGAQNYGILDTNGTTVVKPFTFTVAAVCGSNVVASLQLQDGTNNLGTATFTLPVGQLVISTNFNENFDAVSAPTLPVGWSTTSGGGQSVWVNRQSSTNQSSPNAMFSAEASQVGSNVLVSPVINLPAGQSQLTFQNYYILEASSSSSSSGFDGGVLEIKIGAGNWLDITNAGGTFVTGGYNRIISTNYSNPLAGRSAWSGNSGGFITTTVNLPPGAANQSVQFGWKCGTDSSATATGWYVDSVMVYGGTYYCCTGSIPPITLTIAQVTNNVALGWTSTNGQSYRIQYKNDLGDSNWTDLATNTASGSTTVTNLPATGNRRFYRVGAP